MNQKLWLVLCILAFMLLCFVCLRSHEHEQAAQPVVTAPPVAAPVPAVTPAGARLEGRMENGNVILSGVVPGQEIKTSLADRARALYGAAKVVDNITVDTKLSKVGWGAGVANLASILGGRLTNGVFLLSPDSITLRGQVPGDDIKAGLVRAATDSVGTQIRVIDELTVVAKSAEQAGIDDFLKGKVIEFATGSAVITPQGRAILDQALPYLQKAAGRAIEVSGHTDNQGAAEMNMKLSNDRAAAVKQYLTGKGLPAATLNTVGYGAARPVADNATPEGRQQNRRIEFAIQ